MNDAFYTGIGFLLNILQFNKRKVKTGSNLKIYGRIFISTPKGSIQIGDNVVLRSGLKTNPLGGSDKIVFAVGNKGSIKIGNNVGISNACIRSSNSITIEDDVLIGGDCKIYDTDFHSLEYEYRMEKPDTHIKSAPVLIKKGAFIGAHSIILKGVSVGEKSIVGAGSVVTKDIPDGEIWAGNPARFIRKI